MKAISLFLVLAVHCYAGVLDWFETETAKTKRIRELMEEFEPMIQKALDDYQVPGLVVGIVADGRLAYSKGFGWRDAESKLPVTPDTVFSIGSGSKAFNAFLAGTLVDEGLMHWDQRIIDIYPEFRLKDSNATLSLTMRDLLSHRSGMPQHDLMWYNSATLTRAQVMNRLRYLEPSCEIRERYQYNNVMYLAAGFSMEHLMKRSWEELVAERILKPLGMTHSNFHISDMQNESDFAYPYQEKNDKYTRMAFSDVSLIGPAAGINSSATDLAKWVKMHLNGGLVDDKALISPSSLQEMHAPQIVIPGAPESNESHILATGLGWNILSYRGHYFVSHDGGLAGFTSVIGFFPRDDLGLIVLSNKNLTTLPRYVCNQVMDRLLDLPFINWIGDGVDALQKTRNMMKESLLKEDLQRKKGTQPSHPIGDYAGEYNNDGYGVLVIEENEGNLFLHLNDLSCALEHWHYDVFAISKEMQDMFRSREGLKFSFQNGLNGEIEKLVAPFEPKAGDIVFMKNPSPSLSTTSYLKQFTGVYEIYGYVVEISLNKGSLCAVIPGQPCYELVPEAENEFSVRSLAGYTVRFTMDKDKNVEEVLLVQPYGAFSAKPKK